MGQWPFFAEDEIAAVVDTLASGKVNFWTGQQCQLFEKEFAAYVGCQHAIALANGTLALELALVALGIQEGDEVVTTAKTFLASASCIVMRGAKPVIADIDPVSQNVTAETIEAVLTPKTKAIIVVHLAGWPCQMDTIMALARRKNLYVIEDCAQAHGAQFKGRPVGSWGDFGAFSFCQDKIMSTGGEGGMLVTNNEQFWRKAWSYKDHGKDYDVVFKKKHPPGFRWLHEDFGTNWRLTEMQAAIGRIQLKKLPLWVEKRRALARIYSQIFSSVPCIKLTHPDADVYHSYYKFCVFVRLEKMRPEWSRDLILRELNNLGVPCFTGSCSEIYLENCFIKKGWGLEDALPNAKLLTDTSLVFLVHPTLSEEAVFAWANKTKQFLETTLLLETV